MTVPRLRRSRPRWAALSATLAGVLFAGATAEAQLDPLLFLRRVPPTVIVVVDTSFRMLDDGEGNYYDPHTYNANDNVGQELGLPSVLTYRRIYKNLRFDTVESASQKYLADTIEPVVSSDSDYARFWDDTRLQIAKKGLKQAIDENPLGPRWGLVKLRQSSPAWRTGSSCDRPVILSDAALADENDSCAGGSIGIYTPTVAAANFSIESGSGSVYWANFTSTGATTLSTLLGRAIEDPSGLIPAGLDTASYEDRPISHALDDARQQATNAMSGDTACRACRNTIVVLITGGKDDGTSTYRATHDPVSTAGTFLAVSANGTTKRVPIYVVAIKPKTADEAQLQGIANASGGRYFRVEEAAEVTRAVNLAVQAGYGTATKFDAGEPTEYLPVSPIVGTVNLEGARDKDGVALVNDVIYAGVVKIPQRSNFMITSGFALGGPDAGGESGPGFDGRIRAFRTFEPEEDPTKPSGFKFRASGRALWPDRDGRPQLAGLARVPADPDDRNIYTYVPGSGIVAFNLAHADMLEPYLGGADAEDVIEFVREMPLGAVVGSTPAIMDPPSIDPPPDDAYGRVDSPGTYAGEHALRRSMIWFGANDGMIHGVDARTGYEVWAFIPFNLLPKLRTLMDGQPVDRFDYFVDSSPKIAEVKVDGAWKTALVIGQGPGGVFYQAFDVTDAGMDGPAPDSDDYSSVLTSFRSPSRVRFLWSFPQYSSFDTTYFGSFAVSDGSPGGRVTFYGDLKSTASNVEKSVGFSWSDPAVGPLNPDRSRTVAIVGSGYFPPLEDSLPGRGSGSPRAGRSLYLIDIEDGEVVTNPTSCTSGRGCLDVGDLTVPVRKNSLQGDPTAAGVPGDYVVAKAYLGDLDGKYWRFDFTPDGTITKREIVDTGQPIYGSSALLTVGSSEQYVFFATGSDLLPTTPTLNGGTGPFKLWGVQDLGTSSVTKFTYSLAWPGGSGKNSEIAMERPSTSPSVAGDIVFFTTTAEIPTALCTDFAGKLYAFTYTGQAAYDTNGSGSIEAKESPRVDTVAGRATAPFIVDQHLYFATSGADGAKVRSYGDPQDFNNGVGQVGVRVLSWRELR